MNEISNIPNKILEEVYNRYLFYNLKKLQLESNF